MRTRKALFLSFAALAAITVVDRFVDVAVAQSKLAPFYQFLRPEGSGPFPALMLVPGSPGVVGNRPRQAEELKKQGYVVLFVDYLSARGVPRGGGDRVPREDIVKDIDEAGSYLQSLPFLDPSRIGAIGWSRGGVSILLALAAASEDHLRFRAGAVFYPSCRNRPLWGVRVPVLMLLGAADDAAPAEYCQELVKQLPPDYPINVHVYPDARHSFDRADLPAYQRRRARGGSIGYSADAAMQAWEAVRKFFDTHLKQP